MSPSRPPAGAALVALALAALPAAADKPADLAGRAHALLKQHCGKCHGGEPGKKVKGDLNLFDRTQLLDTERKIVVAREPAKSVLIQRVDDDEEPMPPPPAARLSAEEREVLHDWIAAGAAAFAGEGVKEVATERPTAAPEKAETAAESPVVVKGPGDPKTLAAQAVALFRTRCLDCHGGSKTSAGVKVLDHKSLLAKGKVVPGNPEKSPLFQLVTARDESVMPPTDQPRLNPEDIDLVRRWILAGAPAFPEAAPLPGDIAKEIPGLVPLPRVPPKDTDDTPPAPPGPTAVGVEYVLGKILEDVRNLPEERDRRYVRYFSLNHVLTAGATREELQEQRDALAKAVNHLSWESEIVRPRPIDPPYNTVYAVDIRQLGWDQKLLAYDHQGRPTGESYNVFDLAVLEYPYGILYRGSPTYEKLLREYLLPAGQVRPVAYIRSDWFVSVVTQPPLYDDFLRLPADVKELEARLNVSAEQNLLKGRAKRAGMAVSGVSRNNRVVERHEALTGRGAYYWKSYDFKTSRGEENMFRDPVHFKFSGGEMIFSLPNGLQGYYVADAAGSRIDSAPTDIVTDKFADDKVVRNGLACIRCHDQGMKGFTDAVRPALQRLADEGTVFDKGFALELYPEQKVMEGLLERDGKRFLDALAEALGRPPGREPLAPVSKRYLEAPVSLTVAAGELGRPNPAGLQDVLQSPRFAQMGLAPLATPGGIVRRDAWEDYFDEAVRGFGLGVPLAPIDGVLRRDFPSGPPDCQVELKSNRPNNVFVPGDPMVLSVTNKGERPLYVELIYTSPWGQKLILTSSDTVVQPGQTYRYPPAGQAIKVQGGKGKETVTLYASDRKFPPGRILRASREDRDRGMATGDRVVHRFFRLLRDESDRLQVTDRPDRMVKKTIDIETR